MRSFSLALLGVLIALFCLTTFSSSGYLAIGAAAGVFLYLLFFVRHEYALPALIGWATGLELFSSHHFGTSLLLAMLLYGLYWIFGDLVRFTSRYSRFIVAMFGALASFPLFYYPLSGYPQRLLGLIIVALVLAAASGALRRFTDRPTHALI